MSNSLTELNGYSNTSVVYNDYRPYSISFSANATSNGTVMMYTTATTIPVGIDITAVIGQPGNITYTANATGVGANAYPVWPTLPFGITSSITGNSYAITGTFDAARWQSVKNLTITSPNQSGAFTINSSLTYPNVANTANTNSWNWSVAVTVPVANITARTYTSNTTTAIFAANTPAITDGTDTGQTYTITLTSPSGKFGNTVAYFSSNSYANLASTYSYTGNRSLVNAEFANVRFAPSSGNTGNTTYTYTQTSANVLQANITAALTVALVPRAGNTYTFTANTTYTPTFDEYYYSGTANILLVGGGGYGQYGNAALPNPGGGTTNVSGGAGGGGEVRYASNLNINNTNYTIVVGAAGTANTSDFTANSSVVGGSIDLVALAGRRGIFDISPSGGGFALNDDRGGNGGGNIASGNVTGGIGGNNNIAATTGTVSGNASNGSAGGGGGAQGYPGINLTQGGNGAPGVTHPLTGNLVLGGGGATRSRLPGTNGVPGGNSYGQGGNTFVSGSTDGAAGVVIIKVN